LDAYGVVRRTLEDGLKEAGVEVDAGQLDALDLAREAERHHLSGSKVTDAVLGLNVLYNLAKHALSNEMSPARAFEYLAMADGALYAFSAATKTSRPDSLVVAA
jgi:hypothetical protein